ncbi:hypothetical protein GN956_G22902 [Arapaima gigas]
MCTEVFGAEIRNSENRKEKRRGPSGRSAVCVDWEGNTDTHRRTQRGSVCICVFVRAEGRAAAKLGTSQEKSLQESGATLKFSPGFQAERPATGPERAPVAVRQDKGSAFSNANHRLVLWLREDGHVRACPAVWFPSRAAEPSLLRCVANACQKAGRDPTLMAQGCIGDNLGVDGPSTRLLLSEVLRKASILLAVESFPTET